MESGSIPGARIGFSENIPYGDALLSLDTGGKGVVLSQLNVPGFAEFPWEASECGEVDGMGAWGGGRVG